MKYVSLPALLLAAAMSPALAQPPALHLQASSTTAHAVTGDLTLAPNSVTFGNGVSLALQAVQGPFTDEGNSMAADIFRIVPPSDPILLNGNHLCGKSATASFVVVWKTVPIGADVDPHSVAFFSGANRPASSHAKGLCGIYAYEAAR